MSPVHASPYDSVRIFVETKCKKAIGMHWGESPGLSFLILPLSHLIGVVAALFGSTALAHICTCLPRIFIETSGLTRHWVGA